MAPQKSTFTLTPLEQTWYAHVWYLQQASVIDQGKAVSSFFFWLADIGLKVSCVCVWLWEMKETTDSIIDCNFDPVTSWGRCFNPKKTMVKQIQKRFLTFHIHCWCDWIAVHCFALYTCLVTTMSSAVLGWPLFGWFWAACCAGKLYCGSNLLKRQSVEELLGSNVNVISSSCFSSLSSPLHSTPINNVSQVFSSCLVVSLPRLDDESYLT